jgi:hypothetical protein
MNDFEISVKNHLEKEGWTVLRSGWPDFLCRKKKVGGWEYQAVEVKTQSGDVRPNQQDMLLSLADLIPTFVYHQQFFNTVFMESIRQWIPRPKQPEFDGLGVA